MDLISCLHNEYLCTALTVQEMTVIIPLISDLMGCETLSEFLILSRVNDCVRLAGGSMSRVKIDMQRVLKLTSARKSAAVAILHNHPDGLADPSEEDMEFVSRITELFHLMGLEVIEHIIVAGEEYRALMADKNRRSREL